MKLQYTAAIVSDSGRANGRQSALQLGAGGTNMIIKHLVTTAAKKTVAGFEATMAAQRLCISESNYASGQTLPCGAGLSS